VAESERCTRAADTAPPQKSDFHAGKGEGTKQREREREREREKEGGGTPGDEASSGPSPRLRPRLRPRTNACRVRRPNVLALFPVASLAVALSRARHVSDGSRPRRVAPRCAALLDWICSDAVGSADGELLVCSCARSCKWRENRTDGGQEGGGGRWVSSSGGGVGWVCRTNRRGSRASPRGGRLRAPSPDGATARERSTRGRTRVARPRGAAASVEPGSADSCVRRGCDLRGMIRGAFQHREREREREREGGERERERERR